MSNRLQQSIAIVLLLVVAVPTLPFQVARAAPVNVPNVGVWNDDCFSANMTVDNPNCSTYGATLAPGTQVTIDINVTNAPLFNAFQFSVYYDPTNLTLSSYNVGQVNVPGESPMFDHPFIANPGGTFDNVTTHGAIRAEVVNLASPPGNGTVYGSGVLAYLTFNIKGFGVSPFALAAGTCCPAEGSGATVDDWTRLILGHKFFDVTTSDGYFRNSSEGKLGPVASFSFSPTSPIQKQPVTFNATASFDPDNSTGSGIRSYLWDFGDGFHTENNVPIATHVFGDVGIGFVGNFSVLLTVTDFDNHFEGMVTRLVQISPPPPICPPGLPNVRVPQDCPTIQSAVDSVIRGGSVQVSPGTYKESPFITKTLKLIGAGQNQSILEGGLSISGAPNVTIEGFRVLNTGPASGIGIGASPNSIVSDNEIIGENSQFGLAFGLLVQSRNTTIIGNTITNETFGISLESSPGSMLRGNSMVHNQVNFDVTGSYVEDIDASNTVDARPIFYETGGDLSRLPSNPGYIGIVNSHDLNVGAVNIANVGQGILVVNSTRISVNGLKAQGVLTGAEILNSTSVAFSNGSIDTCGVAVDLDFTAHSNITRNTLSCDQGVILSAGSKNTIASNTISAKDPFSPIALDVTGTMMNQFVNNTITNSLGSTLRSPYPSVVFNGAAFNTLVGNQITGGLAIWNSQGETLRHNAISGGFTDLSIVSVHYQCLFEKVSCFLLTDYVQDIDPSNTVEGKPIYYIVNRNNVVVPSNAGFVSSINSTNVTVKNVNISNNYQDIISVYSTNFSVENSNLTYAHEGIFVQSTEGLTIRNNHFLAEDGGIRIVSSKNGLISGNDIEGVLSGIFLNNSTVFTLEGNFFTDYQYYGVDSYLSSDSQIIRNTLVGFLSPRYRTSPVGILAPSNSLIFGNTIAHNYLGLAAGNSAIYQNNFIDNVIQARGTGDTWDNGSGQGNYWSDYTGQDLNGDGVGDTLLPHLGLDKYPLMSPWMPTGLGATLYGRAAWPDSRRFVISSTNGGILSLNAQVRNSGTAPEWVQAVFNITSSTGATFQLVSQRVWLDPGAQIILTANFSPLPGSYRVKVAPRFSSHAYLEWTVGPVRAFPFTAVP